ncbi:MAG: class I SAM-dependent methyltransferase [Desulfobacterales bacterium]
MDEDKLRSMLLEDAALRPVEANIYSVLPNDETGNAYDSRFGFIYDMVACNSIYNRLIWGYSVDIFRRMANDALRSSSEGNVLDLACGSLAFTAKAYSRYGDRPVILMDQSLKMLRIAKSRLTAQGGSLAGNLVFLHSDASCLPFKENAFTTILSENLLHCLDDTTPLLNQLKTILAGNGKIFFTTLVKNGRWADIYLQALAAGGKLISRSEDDHKEIFRGVGLAAKYETIGNLLSIECEPQ